MLHNSHVMEYYNNLSRKYKALANDSRLNLEAKSEAMFASQTCLNKAYNEYRKCGGGTNNT